MTAAPQVVFNRIHDPLLRRIGERVAAGERLSVADGAVLYRSGDLTGRIGTTPLVNAA